MKEEINYIRKNYIIEKKEYKKITLIQKQELENLEVLNNHLQASENTDKIIQRCLMRIKLLVEDNEIIRKNSTILENEIKDLKKDNLNLKNIVKESNAMTEQLKGTVEKMNQKK